MPLKKTIVPGAAL
jgi:hypothetical protein